MLTLVHSADLQVAHHRQGFCVQCAVQCSTEVPWTALCRSQRQGQVRHTPEYPLRRNHRTQSCSHACHLRFDSLLQGRHCLTSSTNWSDVDGAYWSGEEFVKSVYEAVFYDPDWADELEAWWTKYVRR